jgi:hypothetical protein
MFPETLLRIILTETNRYSQQHTKKSENETLQTDITVDEIYRFITLIILMGHDDGDNIKDYRLTNEFYYTPFYLCHET